MSHEHIRCNATAAATCPAGQWARTLSDGSSDGSCYASCGSGGGDGSGPCGDGTSSGCCNDASHPQAADDYNGQRNCVCATPTALANGICDSGTCQGCPVGDDCVIAAGTFDAVTQQCSAPTVKADGTTCGSETTDECDETLKHNTLSSKPMNQSTRTVLESASHWSSTGLQVRSPHNSTKLQVRRR